MDEQDNKKEIEDTDDVTFEDEDETANPQAVIKKLREKLKVCTEEKQKYLEGWQRDKADFINARKRDEEQKADIVKFATADLISELIPIVDTFDLAMADKTAWEALPKNWREGMESIANQLHSVLADNGVQKIQPLGEMFDPKFHEAVETVPVGDKAKDHTIVAVLQSGFLIHGKVIRPAKVRVGEYRQV